MFQLQEVNSGELLDVLELLQLLLLREVLLKAVRVQKFVCQHSQKIPRTNQNILILISYLHDSL